MMNVDLVLLSSINNKSFCERHKLEWLEEHSTFFFNLTTHTVFVLVFPNNVEHLNK